MRATTSTTWWSGSTERLAWAVAVTALAMLALPACALYDGWRCRVGRG